MKILVCTQVPCSAGTFISRYIAEFLDVQVLVPETNPWALTSVDTNTFSPLFPAAPLAKTGILSHAEYLQIYESSMLQLLLRLEANGVELLLLRDHMFSEWFADPNHVFPFWPEFLLRAGYKFKTLLTARNPLDSYLGLCSSFPAHAVNFTLDQYALLYLKAIDAYEAACPDLFRLTIEELAESITQGIAMPTLIELARWADQSAPELISAVDSSRWQTSGASGRQATSPQLMPRKLFTNQLRKQALSSKAFAELQHRLGFTSEATYLSSMRVRALSAIASGQEALTLPLSRLPVLGSRLHRLRWFVVQPQ